MDNKGMGSCITGELEGAWPYVTAARRRKKNWLFLLGWKGLPLCACWTALNALALCSAWGWRATAVPDACVLPPRLTAL